MAEIDSSFFRNIRILVELILSIINNLLPLAGVLFDAEDHFVSYYRMGFGGYPRIFLLLCALVSTPTYLATIFSVGDKDDGVSRLFYAINADEEPDSIGVPSLLGDKFQFQSD